jgi:AcrR family transcriptional regulator
MYRPDGTVPLVSEITKNKILDSAEAVALRDGVAHLTLDAVAAESGLSKGGVLYNYPSKDALVRGMVERLIQRHDSEMATLAAQDPEPRGRLLRSYLKVVFPGGGRAPAHASQVGAVLLTAVLTNPVLLDPVRKHSAEMQERFREDGLDEAAIHIVRLAAHGMWLSEMLGMPGARGEDRVAVIDRLFELTRR